MQLRIFTIIFLAFMFNYSQGFSRADSENQHEILNNKLLKETQALIIDANSFNEELKSANMCFFGDGAEKCREILEPKGMKYLAGIKLDARGMAMLANEKYDCRNFEDLAYFEPFYLKNFIAGTPKVKGLE